MSYGRKPYMIGIMQYDPENILISDPGDTNECQMCGHVTYNPKLITVPKDAICQLITHIILRGELDTWHNRGLEIIEEGYLDEQQ